MRATDTKPYRPTLTFELFCNVRVYSSPRDWHANCASETMRRIGKTSGKNRKNNEELSGILRQNKRTVYARLGRLLSMLILRVWFRVELSEPQTILFILFRPTLIVLRLWSFCFVCSVPAYSQVILIPFRPSWLWPIYSHSVTAFSHCGSSELILVRRWVFRPTLILLRPSLIVFRKYYI